MAGKAAIGAFLDEKGFSALKEQVLSAEFDDLDTFLAITAEDLRDMGVSVGPRRKLLLAIEQHKATGANQAAPQPVYNAPPRTPSNQNSQACAASVIVSGDDAHQANHMGNFFRSDIQPGAEHRGRAIYQSADSQFYLYYWSQYGAWRIGVNPSSVIAAVVSENGEHTWCPTEATQWYVWNAATETFVPSTVKVNIHEATSFDRQVSPGGSALPPVQSMHTVASHSIGTGSPRSKQAANSVGSPDGAAKKGTNGYTNGASSWLPTGCFSGLSDESPEHKLKKNVVSLDGDPVPKSDAPQSPLRHTSGEATNQPEVFETPKKGPPTGTTPNGTNGINGFHKDEDKATNVWPELQAAWNIEPRIVAVWNQKSDHWEYREGLPPTPTATPAKA